MTSLRIWIALVGMVLLFPARAGAQCTTKPDAAAVLKSAKLAANCNYKKMRSGPGAICKSSPPPACSGTLVSDSIALAWGLNNPAAAAVDKSGVRSQLTCQKTISTGVVNFIGKKLRYLIEGLSEADAEAKARKSIDKIPLKCLVPVAEDPSGIIIPDVGPQMDAAVPNPGGVVKSQTLADALVTLLETWVDRVGPNPAPLRPNIVFILTDDQRFDTIGLTHSIDGSTPVMPTVQHEIVDKGVSFINSYVTTDLCAPSRSSLLAGKYSHTTGVHDNGGPDGGFAVFDDASTLPVWLQAAGYHTGIYGKYLNGYVAPYIAPGWDEWHVFKNVAYFNYTLVENGTEVAFGSADADYSTDVLRDKAVQFIQDSSTQQPFFLYFAPKAPHGPATPAPRHAGSFSGIPPWRPPNYNEADVSDKPAWLQGIAPWTADQMATHDTFNQMQLECLQAVDEAVAAILQALVATGQDKNTMIIYASDNGYSWGSHRWEPKQCPYEECMRVPLAVRYAPLAPLPRTESGFGLNIDHAETLSELAGATPDPGVEGMSMVQLLDGTTPTWRADFLEEHWNGKITTYAQVRGDPWKYTEYTTNESELYNEPNDQFELTNVVTDPDNAAVAAALAQRLRELRPGWPNP
jgi:arylsulfatase A-like enzyme